MIEAKLEANPTPNYLRIKKRCLKIILRFAQRHANQHYDPHFCRLFESKYALSFLESITMLLLSNSNSRDIHNLALSTLPYFHKNFGNCQKVLNQHKLALLVLSMRESVMKEKDIALWNDDPVEFINREKEERKPLVELVRVFDDCGSIVINAMAEAFNQGDEGRREICLYIFSELRNEILDTIDHELVKNAFTNCIFPLLEANSVILQTRAVACVSSYLEDITFPDEVIGPVTRNVYNCFTSPCLQVKANAATALAELIQSY